MKRPYTITHRPTASQLGVLSPGNSPFPVRAGDTAHKRICSTGYGGVEHLIVAEDEQGVPVAFMGTDGDRLEMIFLAPGERGKDLGIQLVGLGISEYGVHEVMVNEQNPDAVGFYEHMGFVTCKRTECDEEGGPYPLLYMALC